MAVAKNAAKGFIGVQQPCNMETFLMNTWVTIEWTPVLLLKATFCSICETKNM